MLIVIGLMFLLLQPKNAMAFPAKILTHPALAQTTVASVLFGYTTTNPDQTGDGKVNSLDFGFLLENFTSPQPSPQPSAGELDISVCDPVNGPFSLNINNEFMPFQVGMVHVLENATLKVEISVLNQTEVVAGVTTRVVQEREWDSGAIVEISRNFFVQAQNGTICYFGEDVDIYQGDQIVAHTGAWRAGEGQNKPGIAMPGQPAVGQTYYQEYAPGVATDRAEHLSMNGTFVTPAGTFNNVLLVNETPPSTKRYQPGIGLIYDDGTLLTSY